MCLILYGSIWGNFCMCLILYGLLWGNFCMRLRFYGLIWGSFCMCMQLRLGFVHSSAPRADVWAVPLWADGAAPCRHVPLAKTKGLSPPQAVAATGGDSDRR